MVQLSEAYRHKKENTFYVIAYYTGNRDEEIELFDETFTAKWLAEIYIRKYVKRNLIDIYRRNLSIPIILKAHLDTKPIAMEHMYPNTNVITKYRLIDHA